MKGNGIAALRVWPVTVDLGGVTYRIAPYPAIRWIIPVIDDDWLGIVPGMLDPVDSSIDHALNDGTVSADDCIRAARDAVGVASGIPWWSAVRLIRSVLDAPDVTGELIMRGIDARTASLGAFVQAAYRIFTSDLDKKQRAKTDQDIGAPPPGLTVAERMESAGGQSGFDAMLRQRGG